MQDINRLREHIKYEKCFVFHTGYIENAENYIIYILNGNR